MSFVYFLLVIGPLVFFHELGHYLAARWFGVWCQQFAVGVGPVLFRFLVKDTEFSVRALPLGGYVLMYGADPQDEQEAEQFPEYAGKGLFSKPVWQRFIIYLAGPLMNLLIAAPMFIAVQLSEDMRASAVVGYVGDGSRAAESGLLPGDRILSIDGESVTYFDDVQSLIRAAPGREIVIEVERNGETVSLRATPDTIVARDEILGLREVTFGQLGMGWVQQASVVHVAPDSPVGGQDGLQTFDRILRIGDASVSSWLQFEAALEQNTGPVSVVVERRSALPDSFASLFVSREVELQLQVDGRDPAALGLYPIHKTIWHVVPGSPAHVAGLQRGDRVISADGRPVIDINTFSSLLSAQVPHTVEIEFEREGVVMSRSLTTIEMEVTGEMREVMDVVFVGFHGVDGTYVAPELVKAPWSRRISDALRNGLRETVEISGALVYIVGSMASGQMSTSNLGGPIMMFDAASRAAEAGWLSLLHMAGLLSVNLAIMNLMPVPGLDGGQLVLLTFEGIRRRPLSMRARQIAGFVGIVCIVLLMLFAFKNDIERYWVDVAIWLNG